MVKSVKVKVKKSNLMDKAFNNFQSNMSDVFGANNISFFTIMCKKIQLISIHNRLVNAIMDLFNQNDKYFFMNENDISEITFWLKENNIDFINTAPILTMYYEKYFDYLRKQYEINQNTIKDKLIEFPNYIFCDQRNKLKFYYNDIIVNIIKRGQNYIKSADKMIDVNCLYMNIDSSDKLFLDCIEKELTQTDKESIMNEIKALENCKFFIDFISVYNTLIHYNYYLANTKVDEINKSCFIEIINDITFKSLKPISLVDFRRIIDENTNIKDIRKIIFSFNYVIYETTSELYQVLSSPNFDMDELINFFINHISEMKSKIPDCNELFDLMQSKIHLLKTNFANYYREQLESGSSFSIVSAFSTDILNCEKKDGKKNIPKLISQFRKMQKFMSNTLSSKMSNLIKPNADPTMKLINEQEKHIEKMRDIMELCAQINNEIDNDDECENESDEDECDDDDNDDEYEYSEYSEDEDINIQE